MTQQTVDLPKKNSSDSKDQSFSRKTLVIALAGNPNSGKTTVFNTITGARQHVGNYPGVTVEKKEGSGTHQGQKLHLVDLPGTYSLTAASTDELIARNFLLGEEPDVVIDIVDSSNLERNLYLATQLLEMNVPLVLAFNMSDVAKSCGVSIDERQLSDLLGVPIVSVVGHKGKGIDEMLDAAVHVVRNARSCVRAQRYPSYGKEVEPHVQQLTEEIVSNAQVDKRARWIAVKLLENDAEEVNQFRTQFPQQAPGILEHAAKLRRHIEGICGDSAEIILADRRYGFISGACAETVRQTVEVRHALSGQIDSVLTNRWLGLPIFAFLMYAVFWMTFTLGEAPMDWIGSGFESLSGGIEGFWDKGSESILKSLLLDGIIGGVGGVIVFLPNIMLLFLAIAFLEDTGYMARVAFMMDRLMHKIGLHGRSFIPMLTGFGCSVPAIMATRTLETRRDRLTTMLVIPLMSCGARLPIYALIIPAFFPKALNAPVLWSIYIIGIVLAIVLARLLRGTVFRGEMVPFLMELPPYRFPTLRGLLIHMWERGWLYLKKAGTVILGVSIVLWVLTSFPKKTVFERDYDQLARQAEAAYVASIPRLNSGLGLPSDSGLLVKAIQTEMTAAEQQEKFWEDQDGFAKVEANKQKALDALTAGEHGAKLATFLEIRDRVEAIHQEFDKAVEENELEESTLDYNQAQKIRDDRLGAISQEDPAIFAAVTTYLDDIRPPFDELTDQLNGQMQSEELSYSIAGRIGMAMTPALRPLGFDWKIGTAFIGAFAAKEVFVAQLGIVYSLGESGGADKLRTQLQANYTPLTGYCIMLFCLISAPCMATIAVTKRESNSWKWAMVQLGGLTAIAYAVTLCVYQVGKLFV